MRIEHLPPRSTLCRSNRRRRYYHQVNAAIMDRMHVDLDTARRNAFTRWSPTSPHSNVFSPVAIPTGHLSGPFSAGTSVHTYLTTYCGSRHLSYLWPTAAHVLFSECLKRGATMLQMWGIGPLSCVGLCSFSSDALLFRAKPWDGHLISTWSHPDTPRLLSSCREWISDIYHRLSVAVSFRAFSVISNVPGSGAL